MPECRKLQAVERDVVRVEIDNVDRGGAPRQIGEHVAAAGADRHHAVVRRNLHRLHVEIGILPDLRVDEAGKKEPEEPFRKTFL
jgi:hypothetical protein